VGDTIHLAGPKNLFRLDESAPNHVLIAGGIGITPILAMADRLKALGKPYALHYAARSRAHMALLARVQRDHGASLSLHVSEEGSRMQLEALLANMGEGTQVYCCGPERLIDAMQALGEGWPEGTLHVEHFSTEGSLLDPAKEHAFEAVLKDSGTTVTVAADQTLLQALQAAGIDVPCDCGEGLCGTCEVGVLDGDADHRDKVLSKRRARRQHPHDELLLPRARADDHAGALKRATKPVGSFLPFGTQGSHGRKGRADGYAFPSFLPCRRMRTTAGRLPGSTTAGIQHQIHAP
jgi:ferredoxin